VKPPRHLLLSIFVLSAAAEGRVTEFMLDNGLKVLVKEDHRAPIVVSQVWYRVGASYEHDGITGISHALEHMMFKGTDRYPAGEFSRIIAENGGTENAFTGLDYTAYFQSLEKSRLEVSFELEADRMRNLALPEEEFAKEIEVVKEERRLRTEDQQEAFAYEVVMATAFQTGPYRQPVIGWMADLETLTAARLREWYRRWYAPDNAVLVVAGDVQPESVHALAQKHFGSLEAERVPPPPARLEVAQAGIKRVTVKRPAEVPYLIMAWKVPVLNMLPAEGIEPWEPYALEVLAGILDGGASARFATRLVRGSETAAAVSASYDFNARLESLFMVDGTPGQGTDVAGLEAAVREQIEGLRNELADPQELDRVKAQVVSADVYQRDSVFFQAMILGMLETVGLPWTVADEYVERVQAVTAEQVRTVARKYLIDDRLTVGELVPLPMDPAAQPRRAAPEDHGHVR
jgi:zinc protease